MPDRISIYQNLPHPLKVAAASMQGYYLRWWRYGAETERLVEEALERETWNSERWKMWQEERLAYILNRAATKIPYYRQYWQKKRMHGDRTSQEVLENWPVLKRENVRANPKIFVADDCDPRKMFRDNTSGTTGSPLFIYLKRETVRSWYALFEARIRRWNGVSIRERWAILGGQLVIPFEQEHPPFWVTNWALNQLYLSSHHISPQNIHSYITALGRFKPTHMIVYPSLVNIIANTILDQNLSVPDSIKVIFSNAEQLSVNHRALISKVFRCPVRNTYGMGEIVTGASECSKNQLHIWPEAGILEVMDDFLDEKVENGKIGRFVATGIFNPDMPLIRYEIGDRGSIDASFKHCDCGRALPRILAIEGRSDDVIVTPRGRKVFWLNPVFYGLPIQEAQIIQETLNLINVKVVPADGFGDADIQDIIQRVQQHLGDGVSVEVEQVAKIPRTKAGKFKAVVSRLNE